MSDVEQPAGEVVYTRGVSSTVCVSERRDRQHVGLLDCDETSPMSAVQAAAQMDGLTAVFRSSEGSHHIWRLRPFETFDAALLWSLDWQIADAEHIQQSSHRGSFVLRCDSKQYGDGSIYKDAPDLIACDDDRQHAVSRPHYLLLREIADDQDHSVPAVDDGRLTGAERLTAHRYMSVTDAAKEQI